MIQVPPQTSDAGKAAVHRCKQLSLSISCPATSYFTFYMQIQKRDGNNSSGMVRADAWNTWDSSLTDSNGRCRYKAVNSIYVCPAYQSEVLVVPRHASVLCHLFRSWSLFHACESDETEAVGSKTCWQVKSSHRKCFVLECNFKRKNGFPQATNWAHMRLQVQARTCACLWCDAMPFRLDMTDNCLCCLTANHLILAMRALRWSILQVKWNISNNPRIQVGLGEQDSNKRSGHCLISRAPGCLLRRCSQFAICKQIHQPGPINESGCCQLWHYSVFCIMYTHVT